MAMKKRGGIVGGAVVLFVFVACTTENNVFITMPDGGDASTTAAEPDSSATSVDATASTDATLLEDAANDAVTEGDAPSDAMSDADASTDAEASSDADAACACFQTGQWSITNLMPCIATYDPDGAGGAPIQYAATSTLLKDGGTVSCPAFNGPATKPVEDWSTTTFKVDCTGTFTLRYRIRVGSYEAPNPMTDCVLGEVTLPATAYPTANVAMAWPNLPAWINNADEACVKKYADTSPTLSPAYGEMIVVGDMGCGSTDGGTEVVFNRVKYCPSSCQVDPTQAFCIACAQTGLGNF